MLARVAILGLCLGLIGPAWSDTTPAPAPAVQPSLAEVRALILRALDAGRPDIAGALALDLLRADPEDSFGHMVMSTVLMRAGNLDEARSAAKLAYRHAETPRQRHEAARVVAATEARDDRFVAGQLWMRRALQAAPSEPTRARSKREYRALRSAAKLRFQLSGQIVPSSNVNNGAADRINVVEGIPVVGILPATSQALSGTIAELGGSFSYRLHKDARSETRLTGTGQVRRVTLTEAARKKAPQADDADYGSTFAAFGLAHHRSLGGAGGLAAARLSLGQVWNGGERSYDLVSGGLSYGFNLDPSLRLTAGLDYQLRHNDAAGLADVRTTGLRFSAIHRLANNDRVALSLGSILAQSENGQSRSETRSAKLSYHRAAPIGPVSLSASLGVSETNYPDYRLLFWAVPGGRDDSRRSAEITLGFDQLDYLGFSPTLTVTSERTLSNVSRFETDELSVSLGLRSVF